MLMAALPAEGLAVARKTLDDSAKAAMEDAVRHHDETALRSLVHKMFVARSSEQALLTLGQWAWESGNLTAARGYWSRLLPPRESALAEPLADALRFPDPQIDPAEIGARLVMASIVEGDPNVAHSECAGFRRRFGTARGRLGDREGILADLLEQIAERGARLVVSAARYGRFDIRGQRGPERRAAPRDRSRSRALVGRAASRSVRSCPFVGERAGSRSAFFRSSTGNFLFANTAEQIFAWDLRTGKPAWAEDRLEQCGNLFGDS